jgi:hypothetical protein
MRKLMLATAAMLGATSGLALAQTASGPVYNPTQGQLLATPHSTSSTAQTTNNTVGQPDTFQGITSNFFGAVAPPAPGTIVIKINGRVETDLDYAQTSLGTAGGKINPISFGTFFRLYPAVDAMAANGLRYGASVEIRENFPGSAAQTTPTISPTAAAPSTSSELSGQTLFVRRAFTYVAADNVGIVRLGQGDGVISMFDPCIFSVQCWDAGAGNFNGGAMQGQYPANAVSIPFYWLAQVGADYGNDKILYMSPQFAGFDFAAHYAPSSGNGYIGCAGNPQPSGGCNGATSGGDPTRYYNEVAAGVRYLGQFGPMLVGAYGVYETASKENQTTGAIVPLGKDTTGAYDNMSFFEAAAFIGADTPMGRFVYSGNWIGGAINGSNGGGLAMRPSGGAPESATVTGLEYFNGPMSAGIEVAFADSQGSNALTGISQRHEFEFGVGGAYALAPGLFLTAEYQYSHRHQGDFNFTTGETGSTNDVHSQGVQFATIVTW